MTFLLLIAVFECAVIALLLVARATCADYD
jgi:hypothetical protein